MCEGLSYQMLSLAAACAVLIAARPAQTAHLHGVCLPPSASWPSQFRLLLLLLAGVSATEGGSASCPYNTVGVCRAPDVCHPECVTQTLSVNNSSIPPADHGLSLIVVQSKSLIRDYQKLLQCWMRPRTVGKKIDWNRNRGSKCF